MNFGCFQLYAQRVEIDLCRTTCQVNFRVDSGIGLIPPEARTA